ncbi:hypothetical protein [Janthinobacterium fluminis]|nr:hypothetical protein [Janthinobacterium fluminis]
MIYQYPVGVDCVWLASDAAGNLAAFVTGGEGAIPSSVLSNNSIQIEDVEMSICGLDVVSDARLLVPMPRPDDFIDIAKRGIYVFDWQDVSRISRNRIGMYEKIAIPTNPIGLEILPNDLRNLAESVKFVSLFFSEYSRVDVEMLFECRN